MDSNPQITQRPSGVLSKKTSVLLSYKAWFRMVFCYDFRGDEIVKVNDTDTKLTKRNRQRE